ncbi:MAG: hypothetical protein CMJ19_17910 [Phycisphaeraceae bacterium]|nr:hypothetical protein [Phycisphaeraceae bacterium]
MFLGGGRIDRLHEHCNRLAIELADEHADITAVGITTLGILFTTDGHLQVNRITGFKQSREVLAFV